MLKYSSLNETEIGFPKVGPNTVDKIYYDEYNQRVFINKEQYFEGISKGVWNYRIGAYQVMYKYMKVRIFIMPKTKSSPNTLVVFLQLFGGQLLH